MLSAGEPVGEHKFICKQSNGAAIGGHAIDTGVSHVPLIVRGGEAHRVGKIDCAVGLHDHVVRSVEALALETVGNQSCPGRGSCLVPGCTSSTCWLGYRRTADSRLPSTTLVCPIGPPMPAAISLTGSEVEMMLSSAGSSFSMRVAACADARPLPSLMAMPPAAAVTAKCADVKCRVEHAYKSLPRIKLSILTQTKGRRQDRLCPFAERSEPPRRRPLAMNFRRRVCHAPGPLYGIAAPTAWEGASRLRPGANVSRSSAQCERRVACRSS
jgi:hypothetical protein